MTEISRLTARIKEYPLTLLWIALMVTAQVLIELLELIYD